MPEYLKDKLARVERRVLRIFNACDDDHCLLFSSGDKMCSKLFNDVISHPGHPLRCFFEENRRSGSRRLCVLRRPARIRTKRFYNSFIRYCPS